MVQRRDEPKDREKFFGNTISLALMQIAKYIFPLVTLPYLARVLGPNCYSVRAYVVSFMVFIQAILDFGFAQSGTKQIAENCDNRDTLSYITVNIYIAKALLSAFGLIVAFIASRYVPILSENTAFLLISFASVALKSLMPDYVLQGLEDMKVMARRYVITQSIALFGIMVLVKGPDQLFLVPALEGLASLISLLWTEVYIRKCYGIRTGTPSISGVKEVIFESFPFFLASAASSFMCSTITFLMGVFPTDPLVISCWSIAVNVIQAVQALWQPISRSLFPHIVKRGDFSLIKKLLLIGVPIDLIGVLVLIIFARQIMGIMGGEDYLSGSYILRGVAPTLLFSLPISLVGYPVLGALGQSTLLSKCIVLTAALQLSFLLGAGLIGHFNFTTIAIARVGSEAILCLLESFFAYGLIKRKNR